MGTRSFPGVKRPGRGVNHPPPSTAVVKERVDLCFYSHYGSSRPVLEWTLHFTLFFACIIWWQNGGRTECSNPFEFQVKAEVIRQLALSQVFSLTLSTRYSQVSRLIIAGMVALGSFLDEKKVGWISSSSHHETDSLSILAPNLPENKLQFYL